MSSRQALVPERLRPGGGVVVLGAGRGLAAVLRALRGMDRPLTAIVSIAYDGEGGGDPEQRLSGEGVGDLRRSLEALSARPGPLLRALRRPLTIERLGRHPLGDLAIASAAAALGDYGQASMWLAEQLGIDAAVLPASTEPARRLIELVERPASGLAARGPVREVRMLRFVGDAIRSPEPALGAINEAEWALLAPGRLYRSILSTAALPDVAAALQRTSARVVWIANLEPDPDEASNMTGTDHLEMLRLHGVRVDAVLHDPSAAVKFDRSELERHGVQSASWRLCTGQRRRGHGPKQLRSALTALFGSDPARRPVADHAVRSAGSVGDPGSPGRRPGAPG